MIAAVEIFPWNENFATGIESIDTQHKRLIELLNILVGHLAYQADAPVLNKIFDELKSYTADHFSSEELIWNEYFKDDAWLHWHKDAHADFISKVIELKAKETQETADKVIEEIVNFLTHWLALHIIESDKRMAKVVLALPSGVSLEQAKENANKEMAGSTRVLIDTVMAMYDSLANRTIQLTREIAKRVKAEEELRATQVELTRLKDAALAASKSKSDFLSNMSHEIRTPLNAISGMAHLIRQEGLTLRQSERMDKLNAASQHLTEVINAILDLSKIEAGKFELEETNVRVESLLGNLVSILHDRAQAKQLQLNTAMFGVHGVLLGDATRLQQALLNYATNAIKFTERGSVTIRAESVEQDENEVLLRFEVIDTGIGIAPEVMPRLFSAFEQADSKTTRRYGGTGLGLAITKKIAQLMGGDAGCMSAPSTGSTFWFTARLKKSSTAPVVSDQLEQERAVERLKRDFIGTTILLVEDEPVNREVAMMMLEDAGLVVDQAENGEQAVEKAGVREYALILMDMQMPVLDGLDAARRIRAMPNRGRVPIIAMTANAFTEDKLRCLDAGMSDFLSKPVDPELLYATLWRWLARQQEKSTP